MNSRCSISNNDAHTHQANLRLCAPTEKFPLRLLATWPKFGEIEFNLSGWHVPMISAAPAATTRFLFVPSDALGLLRYYFCHNRRRLGW